MTNNSLVPFLLKDAPSLIESVFPAQKISFEAQKERKANLGQTLTSLGSYWKGRKPLILVRAIILGILLPSTDDAEADLAIYEKLMAFDDDSLSYRASIANKIPVNHLKNFLPPSDLKYYFSNRGWNNATPNSEKCMLYRKFFETISKYEDKACWCKRPEEVNQETLYASVWPIVNQHYSHLGISVNSFPELIEQLGILRFGHRPCVGDTFCGGGSIPFEALRIGCDTYASDLNPIACMLTWGALKLIGASSAQRAQIEVAQRALSEAVNLEIHDLGIEHDKHGNRAKAYLYCLETRCPETGWLIPMSKTWVISKSHKVIAHLEPDYKNKRFDIIILKNVSDAKIKSAEIGTIQDNDLVYNLYGKIHRIPIKTLRGDFTSQNGSPSNQLRRWEKFDFKPRPSDIFLERLYCIQWITKASLALPRHETFFASVTDDDLETESRVESIIKENIHDWIAKGYIPDMSIETGHNTDQPVRERGWTYWHHLFGARGLLVLALTKMKILQATDSFISAFLTLAFARTLDFASRLSSWENGIGKDLPGKVFSNQSLNTWYNYGIRASHFLLDQCFVLDIKWNRFPMLHSKSVILSSVAGQINNNKNIQIFITDPPYADAVNYHEITEYFIAWLRNNPPQLFANWTWDSRRALAIKGSDDDFRIGMTDSYKAMAAHMSDNGTQCVMFTHQNTNVWSDLISIFWTTGLQVIAAWYIATETTSQLKRGGYVQGTVILILKKRPAGERIGFKQRLLPAVRQEVTRQIESMMHLNDSIHQRHGEPVFNDSDLQMAGYAAALKVLTAYTHIGGEDVTTFALRPRVKGEVTVVDEIVQQAAETASNLLIPDGLSPDTWAKLTGIERFVLRMMDMETAGASKLDNYQNFAKAFHVQDYSRLMADMRPNSARLKRVTEFASRDLTESTELGASRLGNLIIALQQRLRDIDAPGIVEQLRTELPDFGNMRLLLADILNFIERKSPEPAIRDAAEVLAARLRNLRFGE